MRSLDEQYRLDTWFFRAFGTLFVAFGFAALALAVVGLYGVMSFSVGQRTREIGVRMALGAEARSILRLVLGQGALQLATGILLGLGFAAVLSRGLGILLFGVEPWDPAVFAVVVVTLGRVRARGLPHPCQASDARGSDRRPSIRITVLLSV